MVKSGIKVFARLKPEPNEREQVKYEIHRKQKKHEDEEFLVISSPNKLTEYIDNRPESWTFSFHKIFEDTIRQNDIFNDVARPVITSLFEGYNGTIFAYGQTGSGKTYTITGGESHNEHGILPRTLKNVFDMIKKNTNDLYSVQMSYLEIYNENGYDLLDQKHRESTTRLEELPRVEIQEDAGMVRLKNLELYTVKNEKDAMNLLFIGDMNRMTSETPMNSRSSRSHCIFTIVLSVKKFGCDRYCRAKMHLVDLAGSERVYKCAITGTILTEAKYINLSLHYLEQVIVSLGQDNSKHIPYRNSLLTAILRDSLGGNCITIMLANLSISMFNLEETISTCRFAQRVALIKNDVNVVLEKNVKSQMDLLKIENERLTSQIDELKEQLASEKLKVERIDCYEDMVAQQGKKIALLIEMLDKEKIRKSKKTADKMIETEQRILSKIVQKSLNISHSESMPLEDYSSSINHHLHPVETLFHDTNFDRKYFDSSSLVESQSDRIGLQKEFQHESLMLNLNDNPTATKVDQEEHPSSIKEVNQAVEKNPVKDNPCLCNSPKSGPESPRISFKTPRILRQILCLDKKSPRQSTATDSGKKSAAITDDMQVIAVKNNNKQHNQAVEIIGDVRNKQEVNLLGNKLCDEKKIIKELTFSKGVKETIVEKIQEVNKVTKKNENYKEKDAKFTMSLPLTGDLEIDEEIIAFYKAKRSGSSY